MKHRLLLVEDDRETSDLLRTLLEQEGFTVTCAGDGEAGERLARNEEFDVIILDIMLPGKDGLSVLRDMRADVHTPVLMLTAKGDDLDRIIGFEMGADDYLPKPFNPRELVARVKALIRRVHMDKDTARDQAPFSVNNLTISPKRREVCVDGKTVELTSTEFNILNTLCASPNEIISRERLTELALGRKLTRYDRAIDMHLSNLRKKIDDSAIKTVRGAGYMYQLQGH